MKVVRTEYDSSVDSLVAVTKRLALSEAKHGRPSEDFYERYERGEMGDDADIMDWANDYELFVKLRRDVEKQDGGLMAKMRAIQIDGPADFSSNIHAFALARGKTSKAQIK